MTTNPVNPAASGPRGFTLGHRVPPPSGNYRWVQLWDIPVRVMHWLAALSIVVLAVTGLYIGQPYFVTGGSEAADPFVMGWVRFFHFSAAAVLVMTGIVRAYWLFAGNKFERLPALFPLRPRDWVNMWKQTKFYAMVEPHPPRYLGHNPMQQLSYTGIYAMAVLMVITGFALYGQSNPGGLFYTLFNWIGIVLGGMPVVRFIHHVVTWLFLSFIPIHVYLAMRADTLERTGVISSIITGGRFVTADEKFVDDQDM
jgi:Ni/Fe-hydrogenase 1 B-type cytochrome subunit